MGLLGIVLSVVAAWLLRDDGWLWLVAAAGALLQFWTYGIMHNHAVRIRKEASGGLQRRVPRLEPSRLGCCAQLDSRREHGWVCRRRLPTSRWVRSLTGALPVRMGSGGDGKPEGNLLLLSLRIYEGTSMTNDHE